MVKTPLLAAVMAAALGTGTALAQGQPGVGTDDASATAGSSLERSSQSYDSGNSGRDAARRGSGSGTSDGMAGDSAIGTQGATTGSGAGSSIPPLGSGAAGRAYDGSSATGPAKRADVAADRDRALRSPRWVFNDLDGVRRLDPGENSHVGRIYNGPADSLGD